MAGRGNNSLAGKISNGATQDIRAAHAAGKKTGKSIIKRGDDLRAGKGK